MMAMSFTPHHHHGEVVCATSHSVCDEGENECGDGHEHDREVPVDSGDCVAEVLYTPNIERSNEHDDCGSGYCGGEGHTHLFAIADFHTEFIPVESDAEIDFGDYITHCYSLDVQTSVGLRAPPAILC
jgi:hypothetical protein